MYNLKNRVHWKDVVIGLLVAYVVIDVLFAFMMKRKYPSLVEKMIESMTTTNGVFIIVIGIVVGFVAWYFSSRSKECYTPLKISSEENVHDE